MKNIDELNSYVSTNLGRILNELMAKHKVDGVHLSKNTGVPTTTINRLRQGAQTNPTLLTLIPLAKFFSLSISQLIGEADLPSRHNLRTDSGQIPVFSWDELMDWPNIIEIDMINYFTENTYSDKVFTLIIEDDDFDKFGKGSIIVVDPLAKPKHHDLVIVHHTKHSKVTLKQLLKEDSKEFLRSLIYKKSIIELTTNDRIIGVICESKKKFR